MSFDTYDFIFEKIPANVKEQCLQYPWFANLIDDTTLKPIRTYGRQPDHDGDCALFSRTLNSADTILACQSFFKIPLPSPCTNDDEANLGELQIFYCLGVGLDGHQGVCHGGFLSATMDHAMASLTRAYSNPVSIYTRNLHVEYQKPFNLPGPLLCRTWITKVDGRKLWIRGRMEDREGGSYITAEGFFLRSTSKI